MPPRIRSGLGTNLRLRSWYSLNTPMATARIVASRLALPDRTSSTYWLTSQDGTRSGAARSSSVAWHENRSSSGRSAPRPCGSPPAASRAGAAARARGRSGRAARRPVRGHPLEPRLLPVEEAAGLAAAVRLAVAAQPLQVHGVAHAVHAGRADGVAQLHGQLVHPEPPAAELQHLGHERERLQLAPPVEGGQDLGLAANLDDLADAETEHLLTGHPLFSATCTSVSSTVHGSTVADVTSERCGILPAPG